MTSYAGNLPLPVPAGAAFSTLNDPTCVGLLDFFGFYTKLMLDAKLAVLSPTSADACPVANRYPWDPSTHFVRQSFPALYCWPTRTRPAKPHTMVLSAREREISLLYVFDELVAPAGLSARNGLIAAVDATWCRALDRLSHPTYGTPAGTSIVRSLDLLELELIQSEPGFMASLPGGTNAEHVQRGYPSLRASLRVVELLTEEELTDADLLPDLDATIETTEANFYDPLDFMERVLPFPDGQ